ncbi:hypothetical protein JRQ81_006761 [Phrynocephalus forsythii]|uniref:Formamidopyrimidine-DNA glycosylase catalytic domain-containing protein n=1 Tax=Phrynocephalus forsythii TaxID=171643 RepID=A0A9Q0XDU1_9SAUR|nr:hypothetical protein JRQ81_006761 [Phrynocephalus forsythii]
MDLVFRFGMSGSFRLVPAAEMPKHAHLRFYTKGPPPQALCYVDFRRFGRWEVDGAWQPGRGPCVMTEYERFRENVLRNLPNKAFDKPICEALLNQKFFNGIGNYLRAEILYRLKIPPFEKARTVLEQLQSPEQTSGLTLSKKVKLKQENPDLLELCHMVPMEVIKLGGKGYDPDSSEDSAAFEKWLQCYYVDGMKSLRDANGRTIWFQARREMEDHHWFLCNTTPRWAIRLFFQGCVKKLVARRNSRTSIPPKGVEETRKPRRRKGSNTIKETEDGIKTPKMRAKRKTSTPREAAVKPDSPAENQKRPTSARKKLELLQCHDPGGQILSDQAATGTASLSGKQRMQSVISSTPPPAILFHVDLVHGSLFFSISGFLILSPADITEFGSWESLEIGQASCGF